MSEKSDGPNPIVTSAPRPDVPHVMQVGDGDLVLTGGNHAVLTLMSAQGQPKEGSVATFWSTTAARAAICAERGIAFSTWVFPDKLTLFADDPAFAGLGVASLFRRHYLGAVPLAEPVHYLGDVITEPSDFQQTDTHLSASGMCKAVLAMAQSLDLPGRDEFAAKAAATWVEDATHCGDLGVKFDPPISGRARVPKPVIAHRRGFNGIAAGNDGMMDLLDSPKASSDKTLLIFGDSFFRQNLVYLSFFFCRIVFLRSRYFHSEMIAAVRPDVIFCGMAERYLSHPLPDEGRPHFLSYPYVSGRAVEPSALFAELWSEMIDGRQLL